MAKKYDAGMKALVEAHLPDWLALVPRKPRGPVRVIDSDVATVTAEADKVLLVEDPAPWILHVELQSKRDASLEWRVPWYNAILEYKHKCLVHSIVVLLTEEAETPGLTGQWIRAFEGEPPYRYLRYQVVRVWELHAAELARGPWGMFPLAPLCADAENLMPGLIQQMGHRVRSEHSDPATARELWTITEILLGLRYRDPLLTLLVKEMKSMVDLKESLSYQMIVAEGIAEGKAAGIAVGKIEGKAEGRVEGRIDALRDMILRQGKKKIGKPSAKIVREVKAITDERRLMDISERILEVQTWKDLLAPQK